jgi:hypothetical protein
MHMTDIGNQSAWQPITIGDIAPWVRPAYYGHIITSTLIGPNNDTTIAEIDIRNQELQDYAGLASSYVIYRGDKIYAAVLINLREFNQTDTESSLTQLNFTLNVPPAYAGNNLTVFKLSAPGADSFKDVTWAGYNFQTADGVPVAANSNDTTSTLVSVNGELSVLVRDSQAVVVMFNGSTPVALAASGTPSTSLSTTSPFPSTSDPSSTAYSNSTDGANTGSKAASSVGHKSYGFSVVFLISALCICIAFFVQ